MQHTLRERIVWRLRHHPRQALLRVVGRPVYCANCGRELFRAVVLVRGGQLRVIGAQDSHIRVGFTSRVALRFSHLELDQCPSPERPWVR